VFLENSKLKKVSFCCGLWVKLVTLTNKVPGCASQNQYKCSSRVQKQVYPKNFAGLAESNFIRMELGAVFSILPGVGGSISTNTLIRFEIQLPLCGSLFRKLARVSNPV